MTLSKQKSSENLTQVHLSVLRDGKLTEAIWPILLWEAADKVFTNNPIDDRAFTMDTKSNNAICLLPQKNRPNSLDHVGMGYTVGTDAQTGTLHHMNLLIFKFVILFVACIDFRRTSCTTDQFWHNVTLRAPNGVDKS